MDCPNKLIDADEDEWFLNEDGTYDCPRECVENMSLHKVEDRYGPITRIYEDKNEYLLDLSEFKDSDFSAEAIQNVILARALDVLKKHNTMAEPPVGTIVRVGGDYFVRTSRRGKHATNSWASMDGYKFYLTWDDLCNRGKVSVGIGKDGMTF